MKIEVSDISGKLRKVFPSYKKSPHIKTDLVDKTFNTINLAMAENDYLLLAREINGMINTDDDVLQIFS